MKVREREEAEMRKGGTLPALPSASTTSSPYVERVMVGRGESLLGRQALLSHLDIELTERCNSDCIHCCINLPMADRSALEREMSTSTVKAILTQAASLGCLSVRFTGGEPLLREDFEELYLFTRRLGMKVTLFTNARLVTPRLADLFARVRPGERVEVSVYGMRPGSYEAVSRAPGSYAEFRRGVELLLDRRIPLIVKGALLPPNIGELDEFEAWAATLPGMEGLPASSMFFDLRGRRDSPTRNRRIAGLRVSAEAGVAFLNRHQERYLRDMRQFCVKFLGPAGDRLFTCGAGQGICIDAYGNAQACLLLRHPDTVYDLGNGSARRREAPGSLEEALFGFFPRVREMKAGHPDYLSRCARCFLKSLCGQCPAKSWTEHGTLDTPVEYL
ncbi:MAG: radical SAM protein, partial [candidate division WOR-3 bacterium]